MIKASKNIEEVDEVFEKYARIKTYQHKIEFLKKHFNVAVCDKRENDSPEFEYAILVNGIITE